MADRLIGAILVERGVMKQKQVDAVLQEQQRQRKPFGKLANHMFGIPEREVHKAWAAQTGRFCDHVDLACEPSDENLIHLLTAREAWLIRALPLRVEQGELIVASTVVDLPEAMGLLRQKVRWPIRFVVADRKQLEYFLLHRYAAEPVVEQAVS
jgi:hypothetical protein